MRGLNNREPRTMKAFLPKDLLPLTAATAAALLLLAGGLRAEVTDFPPQARQPYEKAPSRAKAPAGAPATVRTKGDAPAGKREAVEPAGEPGPYILGDEYWQAAYEYCRSHGGRMIDGGRLCIM